MAYCTPLEVWDELGITNDAEESVTSVTSGYTISLSNKYLIDTAFPSNTKTIILTIDGNVQASSDYTIDKRMGEIDYSGTDTGDGTVEYKYAPIDNATVSSIISDVEKDIDKKTGTTFDGTVQLTDEVYNGNDRYDKQYLFRKQPVTSISSVEVNVAELGEVDDWKSRTEGRGEDYLVQDHGVLFMSNEAAPDPYPHSLRVTYSYGYSSVPGTIRELTLQMTIDRMMNNQVLAANIKGKDNFDPETVSLLNKDLGENISSYRIDTYGFSSVAKEGS